MTSMLLQSQNKSENPPSLRVRFDATPWAYPKKELHARQHAARNAVLLQLENGLGRQMVSLPTGVGKTLLAVHLATHFKKTLFLVHTVELLKQSVSAFEELGIEVGVLWRKRWEVRNITVGMIPSMGNRIERIDSEEFDVVFVDEGHHATSTTWARVINHFRPVLRLGLSATPEREDGASLADLFGEVTYQMAFYEAVMEGYIVPPLGLEISTNMPLQVSFKRGDFDSHEVESQVNTKARNQIALDVFKTHGANRKGIAFTAGVKHARDLAKLFSDQGIKADFVYGEDPMRDEKLLKLRNNQLQIIFNASMLIEGYDDPTINLGMILTITRSEARYQQAMGRAARLLREGQGQTWNGKPKRDFLWIDLRDQEASDDRQHMWRFYGINRGDQMNRNKIRPLAPVNASQVAVETYASSPEIKDSGVTLETFLKTLEMLKPPPANGMIEIDPMYALRDPTANQLEVLRTAGFDTEANWTYGGACKTIAKLPATSKQEKLLLAYGFDVINTKFSRDQAKVALTKMQDSKQIPDWDLVRKVMPKLLKKAEQ